MVCFRGMENSIPKESRIRLSWAIAYPRIGLNDDAIFGAEAEKQYKFWPLRYWECQFVEQAYAL